MSVSQHEEKMLNLQYQMRQNQSELQTYLADLDNWESEIKVKEEKLKSVHEADKNQTLPPVRNTIQKKKLKKKKKERSAKPDKPKKISGYDFRAWDKYDVDKALEEVDKDEKKETSSSEYETDEEWEMERKKHLASLEKEKGNELFKKGDLDLAIEAYTKGIELDSTNSVLPANRAMAFLKQQKFGAAELDCTSSISLDPLYIKAYLRRATARSGLGKLNEAVDDYNRVLELEPGNKQAKLETERLEKEMKRAKEGPVKSSFTETQTGIVKPVYKPPEERSKIPLKTITIEEIGIETQSRPQPSVKQSEVAKKVTLKEGEKFDKLFTTQSSSNSAENSSDPSHSISDKKMKSETHSASTLSPTSDFNRFNSSFNHDSKQVIPAVDTAMNLVDTSRNPADVPVDNVGKELLETVSKQSQRQNKNAVICNPGVTQTVSTNGSGDAAGAFGIPQTSFQFQSDFKLLKKKPDAFFQYFQNISPAQYPKLFGQSFDADILTAIIKSLSINADKCQESLYDILLNLTLVKRFSMTAMFLSSKDKQVVKDLMKKVLQAGKHTEEDLSSLKQKYDL